MPDRLIDRVLDPKYVERLADLELEELRTRREDAVEAEKEVSAVRRSLHKVIEVLERELSAREAE